MKSFQIPLAAILAAAALAFLTGCLDVDAKDPASSASPKKGSGSQVKGSASQAKKETGEEAPAPIDRAALVEKLTPLQYKVAVENGTEPPFRNEYWDNKKEGIYVDIVSGKPLFSSKDKFASGTGWPSFTKPLVKEEVLDIEDRSHGMVRVEVRGKTGDTHLGHVFTDGPEPTGLRYCINSASLRFIPKEDLEKEGLGEYVKLFE